ncbi:SDR family oxidoreductase [Methylobacterium nigriterrae]|uniref:SDR family oxidoreductase n=1 Tax=Methylobacterium nigriterrae TaxID=3127512 RepID=UPI0030134BD4
MKIVVVGGSGLIGSKTVARLQKAGHDVVTASPNSGVNTLTGEGLAEALRGSEVVVDAANSPSFADEDVMALFTTSGRNLIAAETEAGVRHHVALSVVGTARLQESGYFRGKQAQEDLIRAAGLPYTIVQATQFFEFLGGIASSAATDGTIHLPPAAIQPMSSDDVAAAVAEAAVASPVNGVIEIAGPERFRLDELVRRYLETRNDARAVVTDPAARYFGARLDDASLVPAAAARLGIIHFGDWLAASSGRA